MIYEICRHLRNFFPIVASEKGAFNITNNTISLPFVQNGQYILIEGSAFNDGIYEYPPTNLKNETFNGIISVRAIPSEVISLADEIADFKTKNELTNIVGESFGGYSYTKQTNANGNQADWQDVFKGRLNTWRKM